MALFPLPIKVELLLNGTWTDVSAYCYVRDGIAITGGAVNWGDTPQPASMTLTFNNRDGRFTPNYVSGAYYPYLARNIQIRVSVAATSSSGNFYSGFRFWGNVPEWPPLSDISGNDAYVSITASGPLRKISQGGGQGSALTRYYASLTGSFAPVAYWPCEEDPMTGTAGSAVPGGTLMNVTTGSPTWKAISNFNGSEPVGVLNNSTWDGLTGSSASSGDDVFTTPGTYTWVAQTSTVDARVWGPGGGGANGASGAGGGGGEEAEETALAVTVGKSYTVIIGAGGAGGRLDTGVGHDGQDGSGPSSFQGDAVTVIAHPGKGAVGTAGGLPGTGSTNTAHHDGGFGGASGVSNGGSSGGTSGGTSAAGNAGIQGLTNTGAASPVTPAGAGGGGKGGNGGPDVDQAGFTGGTPGGGGGGGGIDSSEGEYHSGGTGGPGKVELIYTPTSVPTNNVIRFLLFVPAHGGNNGAVLLRALTGGTIGRLDVQYATGGKLRLLGYSGGGATLFDSGAQSFGADSTALMVSVELAPSGANMAWSFSAIKPGAAAVVAKFTGTVVTASIGNVSEIIAAPNHDVTKTAMGHISLQYALIPLTRVSAALNGHDTELCADRFIRLANEQAMDNAVEFREADDHWGFETGTQSWTGTNASVSQSAVTLSGTPWSFACNGTPTNGSYFIATTAQAALVHAGDKLTDTLNPGKTFTVVSVGAPFAGFNNITVTPMAGVIMGTADTVTQVLASGWPTDGAYSLLITAAGGAGQWFAGSPGGTSGRPVNAGDTVSAAIDVYCPAALGAVQATINWYTAAGTYIATTAAAPVAVAAGAVVTVKVTGTAPATTAFFSVQAADAETVAAGVVMYADNVRVHPQMGVQTRKDLAAFLKEIKTLDQGILKESRTSWGLKYRTRIAMINQSPAVTLDYAQGMISPPLTPIIDNPGAVNNITVSRNTGSKVTVTQTTGTFSTSEPPAGAGNIKKTIDVVAASDLQLLALAYHLLTLGTVTDERFPTVTVNLARCSLPGSALAPLMSAVAGADIGDYVKMVNLPFWMPSATARQLIIGYTEKLGPREWTITWNCAPEAPYEMTASSIRRW